jgi:hypothetical protein
VLPGGPWPAKEIDVSRAEAATGREIGMVPASPRFAAPPAGNAPEPLPDIAADAKAKTASASVSRHRRIVDARAI